MVNATLLPVYPREKDPLPIAQEAGWDPGPIWTGVKILALTGIRSPDCPARKRVAIYPELLRFIITVVPLGTKLS